MARLFTYTNKELEAKINEYFKHIDETPLYRYEQRKGNISIPKGFEGDISEFDSLIKIPLPRIYLEGQLCVEFLGFDKDYLSVTLKKSLDKLDKNVFESDEERESVEELVRIITRAKEKCSGQKIQLASAGLANPMIVSRLEGLKERTDVTSDDQPLEIGSITIIKPEDRQSNAE